MDKKIRLKIRMLLESDAIFGSGYSIPGEEDIAVCKDEKGYPYMKGSTFKGLLRESMENLALWTKMDTGEIEKMTGVEGWNEESEERRIHLTSLKLENPPKDPEECYALRTFTSLENGVIKKGTLRTAVCISRTSTFLGELSCAVQDKKFVEQALKGIKYVGTLRNRGFGKVKITYEAAAAQNKNAVVMKTNCIHYRLRAELPLVMTDPTRSKGYHYETLGYIPGSAIRGVVVNYLATKEPEWFDENKAKILREINFLDAVPGWNNKTVLPSIKGFYEKKDGSEFQSVLTNGELSPGVKRAGMGTFCTIENGKICYWSAETGAVTRIRKEKNNQEKLMFQTHYLCEGQVFEGYILLPDETMAEKISKAFTQEVWVGSDRFEGFGKCEVMLLEGCCGPAWRSDFGFGKDLSKQKEAEQENGKPDTKVKTSGKTLYMLAVSPFSMLDENGNPCGLNEKELAEKLEVKSAEIEFCSTSVGDFRTYNRTWKCSNSTVRMYDRGSIFKIKCSEEPEISRLLSLQNSGIGIRKAEGFGQILFIRPDIYGAIRGKEAVKKEHVIPQNMSLRRAKYRWIMETASHPERWKGGLSNSQIGEIQSILEKGNGNEWEELIRYFEKNRNERGARHGARFAATEAFIKNVRQTPFADMLKTGDGIDGVYGALQSGKNESGKQKTDHVEADHQEKINLLCMLFDYSRKGEEA